MSGSDDRLRRAEGEGHAAFLARAAQIVTVSTGRPTTAAEGAERLAVVEARVAPFLARGLEPLSAYARAYEVDEAELLAEAKAWADALPS